MTEWWESNFKVLKHMNITFLLIFCKPSNHQKEESHRVAGTTTVTLEIIDPALFIYRFAAHLNLDEKANQVAMTALRLVSRMKRDWIVAGRRPAGICAAALLIASRAHGRRKRSCSQQASQDC